jgi:hypothetical protein
MNEYKEQISAKGTLNVTEYDGLFAGWWVE